MNNIKNNKASFCDPKQVLQLPSPLSGPGNEDNDYVEEDNHDNDNNASDDQKVVMIMTNRLKIVSIFYTDRNKTRLTLKTYHKLQ